MDFLVLSSSRGTTFQAVLDRLADGSLTARCAGLISDREDRECAEKARAAGVPVEIVERKKNEDREKYDERLQTKIEEMFQHLPPNPNPTPNPNPILAALGWMFIFSPWFVNRWKNRILNVHPALLPKYPGNTAIRDALTADETETGMTIHLIDEGVDTGPILVQKKCSILPNDTEALLKERVQVLEKEWYPKTLQMIHTGELKLPIS